MEASSRSVKELKEQCLYLHFDGVRYCFKKDPNVTLLIEQESDAVGRDERQVEERIKEMLEARISGRNAVVWRSKSGDIPDKEQSFLGEHFSDALFELVLGRLDGDAELDRRKERKAGYPPIPHQRFGHAFRALQNSPRYAVPPRTSHRIRRGESRQGF